ncbi:PorT family protein [Chryseobacterium suipulveris]|uniref:PorT family protein n=1 Tax=Chryseobacterium suipulveris TaxID=2929800 RepID=A0ABY4BNZ9_9FLAO|nr:outer membrane beta-barrel protein [Chryseobacterium suipulveris]UOE40925.1 PorT family protein [Chryseobacterium suipulveris]
MKTILSTILLAVTVSVSAQVKFAAKGNLLFKMDKPTWENITSAQTYGDKGKNNVGFNFGLSAKIDLPATSLFVMPEVYYTTYKSEFDIPGKGTTLEIKSNRIDIPVLLGYDLWSDILGIYAGPVASYNLDKNDQFKDFKEDTKNKFLIGYQFGAQAMFKNIILNARYEGSFTDDQRDFIDGITNTTIRYDSKPGLIIVGLGYSF